MLAKNPVIRTIYLYMFSLVGLVLLTIGAVRFLEMGLKAYVFTMAEEEQQLYRAGVSTPYALTKLESIPDDSRFTDEEVKAVKLWLAEYEEEKGKAVKFDYVKAQRHRDAATNLALIIVGLPLYLYHWSVIRRETKKNAESPVIV
ncbi:MAG: hypothetical protein PHW33_03290 [Candidatus Portnoybacteria bacterium]|jgi:hypothetical protein|nr:hypothetical protein [Candidatus Portnoybacteria bacterium]